MNRFVNFKIITALVLASILSFPALCVAWGTEGHRIVGAIGLDYLDKGALNELHKIMGSNDTDSLRIVLINHVFFKVVRYSARYCAGDTG